MGGFLPPNYKEDAAKARLASDADSFVRSHIVRICQAGGKIRLRQVFGRLFTLVSYDIYVCGIEFTRSAVNIHDAVIIAEQIYHSIEKVLAESADDEKRLILH